MTLLEVLLAVFIFGIGILWVLQIMTQNIGLIDRTKLRAQATLLSKEAMELAFHHRETNVLLGYHRECTTRDSNVLSAYGCSELLTSWSIDSRTYLIANNLEWSYTLEPKIITWSFLDKWEKSRLYRSSEIFSNTTVSVFNHDNWWEPTHFGRYIQFDKLLTWTVSDNLNENLIKATVTTLYLKWASTWSVVLESFIWHRE